MCSTKKKTTKPAVMLPDWPSDLEAPEKDDELELIHAIFGEDFSQLSTLYQSDSPKRIAILNEALAAGDRAQVARVAHAFSGSCASIGATRLSALCKELELLAKDEAAAGLEEQLAAVEAEYQRVSAKLQSFS
jgi:HPt (histidine-containing phosphotransfer) domain-containing protein